MENLIIISNMAIYYAIFYEFIKKIIENASLKYGEKRNCADAEALCPPSWLMYFWNNLLYDVEKEWHSKNH